jgi:hypothetical protein
MEMKLFSIKDMKANYFFAPQVYRNAAEAIRSCENTVNGNQDSLFKKNPEDFALVELGSWDEVTGAINSLEKKHICDLIDLRKQQEPKQVN